MPPKHLQRYVNEFAGRHNSRELDTVDQMAAITNRLVGKSVPYQELIRENGNYRAPFVIGSPEPFRVR